VPGPDEGTPTSSGFLSVLLEDTMVANGIEAAPVRGAPGVMAGAVSGTVGHWNVLGQVDDTAMGVVIYSVFPEKVPEPRRSAVAELAARANHLLRYGNLELDFADGDVRVRTSARGGDDPPDFHVISQLVRTNIEVAELLFPAVAEVADNAAPPEAVLSGLLQRINQG
jgi:hypothetical protein